MREWLLDMRKEDGLTGKDMAAKLGISEAYYNRIEHGQRKKSLSLEFCMKLAEALGRDWFVIATEEARYGRGNQ